MVKSHIAVADPFTVHESLISLGKFFHLDLFVSEGFHGPDAGQAVLDLGIDIRDLFPPKLESPLHPSI